MTGGRPRLTDSQPEHRHPSVSIDFPDQFGYTMRKIFQPRWKTQQEADEKLVTTNRKARTTTQSSKPLKPLGSQRNGGQSLRSGNANIVDGYAMIRGGEVWLLGAHISPYEHGSHANVDPTRNRKLLLHKKEIRKLVGKTKERGLTIIPLKIYFKNGSQKFFLELPGKARIRQERRNSEARR
jgi:SsrA-binding protein